MRYRKKPVTVEAVRLSWRTWNEVCGFVGHIVNPARPARYADDCSDDCGESGPYIELDIPTSEGTMRAMHGDWIIRGTKGELYPCKPDVFAEVYEPVEEPGT